MPVRIRPDWSGEPPLYHRLNRWRWHAARLTTPSLRGQPFMALGAGAYVIVSPNADLEVGREFRARGDLTLSVRGRLRIGERLFLNRGVTIGCLLETTIGDSVRVGPRTIILDSEHVFEPLSDLSGRFGEYEAAPVRIGDRVAISAHCVVLAGASIGDDSVIGAGSVVRGAIPPRVVAAGSPARVIRELRP